MPLPEILTAKCDEHRHCAAGPAAPVGSPRGAAGESAGYGDAASGAGQLVLVGSLRQCEASRSRYQILLHDDDHLQPSLHWLRAAREMTPAVHADHAGELIPAAPAPAALRVGEVYDETAFVAALRPLAEHRTLSDDTMGKRAGNPTSSPSPARPRRSFVA